MKQVNSLQPSLHHFGALNIFRVPYGLSSIRMTTEWQMPSSGFRWMVDDIIINDSNVSQHIAYVRQFLQRCTDMYIAFNLDKCKPNSCLLVLLCQPKDTKLTSQLLKSYPTTLHQQIVLTYILLLGWLTSFLQALTLLLLGS